MSLHWYSHFVLQDTQYVSHFGDFFFAVVFTSPNPAKETGSALKFGFDFPVFIFFCLLFSYRAANGGQWDFQHGFRCVQSGRDET